MYTSAGSPASSAPSTVSAAVVEVTVAGVVPLAFAAVATVGAALVEVTVTLAVPDFVTAETVADAVTVKGPPAVVAVKTPLELIVPPPATVHENVGAVVKFAPNWSFAVAL